MIKVVITIENPEFDYSILVEYLKRNNCYVEWRPFLVNDTKSTIERIKNFDAVLAGGDFFCKEVLQKISNTVKIIARFGTGYDKIDMEAATKLGIAVTNTPGRMSSSVAEMALLLMLCVSRRICKFNYKVKKGDWWQKYVGTQTEGKTVGLVGFGQIAQKLAKYLQGFSCNIIAYDKYFDQSKAKKLSVECSTINQIFEKSDYVSIHVPLTQETKDLINYKLLSSMKPSAYLINTSRGGIVNEKDLVKALQENKIAGAGLDVLEKEPVECENPLLQMDNVIISPHIAAITKETFKAAGICAAENIITIFDGKTPPNILNPEYVKFTNSKVNI
jgi:D-3-phosphoglycerate dehydrogenase